ncbi:unnamed protein product [Caenorhabditis angaria]|uniref:Uncharacterized protein n=1 Tax=Caenorhabditis angaria TaxID=860376 RepID=A0A9P1MT32_9PELO|nr:unnamed protein product [Caenorhabditis angaria]
MSVRDFLKTNPPLMKRDSEQSCDEDNNDEQLIDETIRKYNKFRVRNPPKKYKRNPANSSSSTNSTSNIDPKPVENIIDPPQIPTTSNPEHSQHIVMPSVQRFDLMQTQNIYCPQTSFIVQNQTSQGIPDLKYHLDNPESNWKAVETSSTSSSSFMDHQHSNFLPFMSSEPHSRSAFVPAYHKERR